MFKFLSVIGPLDVRNLQLRNVECLFPRFLQLVLNDICTNEEKLRYSGSPTSFPLKQKKTGLLLP